MRFFECDSEPPGSIKCGEFLEWVQNHWIVNNDSDDSDPGS